MTHSMVIPQDIIYKVIAEVGDDKHLLKQCALVSSSFLLPSRKQLFSKIVLSDDAASQRLHQCLIQNPAIQSFVRSIVITRWPAKIFVLDSSTSLGIIRLPFCYLESFSIDLSGRLDWSSLSRELKDALSNIIHLSTLKTLSLVNVVNVPITLFLGIAPLTQLELNSISPNDFDGAQTSSLTPVASLKGMASLTVIDQCIWNFWEQVHAGIPAVHVPSTLL